MTLDIKHLSSRLGPNINDPDVSSEWMTLMKTFSVSSEDLLYKWESFVIHAGDNDLKISMDNMKLFQDHLQGDLEEKAKKISNHSVPSSVSRPTPRANIGGGSPDIFGTMLTPGSNRLSESRKRKAMIAQTPSRIKTRVGASDTIPSSSPIGSNQLSSPLRAKEELFPTPASTIPQPVLLSSSPQIVETLNGHLPNEAAFTASQLSLNINLKKFNYRTMYQKLGDSSEVLNLQITDAMEWIKESYGLEDDVFGNPALQSQTDIIAVGRIVSDSANTDKLNAKSMMLESSRESSQGMRVRINVEKVFNASSAHSFFPGQIVAFKGSNADGKYFTVKEVLELPLLPNAATSKSELEAHLERQDHKPVNILIAAGPYTDEKSFEFNSLKKFVNYVSDLPNKPTTIILNGPFLDFNHPLIKSGDFTIPESYSKKDSDTFSPDDIFKAYVKPILSLIDPSIQVIMIPSINDIISNHAVYPQTPLDRKTLELAKNFRCLSNPATFQINEVVFNTTSMDSLRDIVGNLVASSLEVNRIYLAMEHIIRQRRAYPVFPARLGTSLEVGYLGLGSINVGNPDIIITPSLMHHSAQIVNNVVSINPGWIGKSGTFASVVINPLELEEGEQDDLITHKVWERARVDIVKL